METAVAYTNNTRTTPLPRIKKAKKVMNDIPEGYMSLEQFEKELVEAVIKKIRENAVSSSLCRSGCTWMR